MGKQIGKIFGLGSEKQEAPRAVALTPEPRKALTSIDPNQGDALRQARKRAAREKTRKGRSAMRIDLASVTATGGVGLNTGNT